MQVYYEASEYEDFDVSSIRKDFCQIEVVCSIDDYWEMLDFLRERSREGDIICVIVKNPTYYTMIFE